jgi:hypothetical protein
VTPVVVSALITATRNPAVPGLYLAGVTAVSLLALIAGRGLTSAHRAEGLAPAE